MIDCISTGENHSGVLTNINTRLPEFLCIYRFNLNKWTKIDFSLYFSARSKYGDLGVDGLGWETKMLFIFKIPIFFTGSYTIKMCTIFIPIKKGEISKAQRYKIK